DVTRPCSIAVRISGIVASTTVNGFRAAGAAAFLVCADRVVTVAAAHKNTKEREAFSRACVMASSYRVRLKPDTTYTGAVRGVRLKTDTPCTGVVRGVRL